MEHKKFYKNVFWQYGLQALKYVFPLILVPYLTRVLGTQAYAVYAYVLSFMGIMQTIADFGFTLSGTKKVVEDKGNKAAISRLVGAITGARFMLIGLLLLVTLGASFFIPIMLENVAYVVLAFLAVATRALLPDFVFQGFEQMGPLTTRYFAAKGSTVVLTLLFVHSSLDLLFVAVADIIGGIIGLVWSYIAIWRMFGIGIRKASLIEMFSELKDSAIYCFSNISSTLFSGFSTIIIGLALTNKTDIAFWSLTLTTVNAIQSLYLPVTNSLYPHMINGKDFAFAKKLCLVAFPVLVIGTIMYCIFAEPIMLVLGGSEYTSAAHVMRMISPVFVFSFYGMLIGWPVIGALGYVKELTASTVFAGLVNVVVLLVIYWMGAATLDAFCIVRWFADAVLMLSRLGVLWFVKQKRMKY
ncbi:oligosaccharide flippase family protein [Bifidobacterium longum]|uniref:oligosaccharide flippase family protein n=1 Tax=Bifidobacterium longum TaxID=216816 RepID=UPI0030D5A9A9